MDLGLQNKVAFVAAASKGLGYATALGLAREGAKVAICSRSLEAAQEAISRITTETGGSGLAIRADVTQEADIKRAIEMTVAELGGLHILVPNSGGPPPGKFETLDETQWQSALDSTLFSTTRLIHAALPH